MSRMIISNRTFSSKNTAASISNNYQTKSHYGPNAAIVSKNRGAIAIISNSIHFAAKSLMGASKHIWVSVTSTEIDSALRLDLLRSQPICVLSVATKEKMHRVQISHVYETDMNLINLQGLR